MKLEPGNTNYELAWGSAGIVDYFDALGGGTGDRAVHRPRFRVRSPRTRLCWARSSSPICRDRNDVRIIGRRDSAKERRVPTISFKVEGRDAAEIVRSVEADRIGIRFGDFHSRRLIEHLGLADR